MSSLTSSNINLNSIGVFKCDETKKYDVPRQAILNPRQGQIHLHAGFNFEQALEDLSGFSHIWLIYIFNNKNWKPKVQTPRSLKKKGVFSTRSPYRPNPIGISLVELQSINKLQITIQNYDLLNNTQILDIKPYIDYSDSIPDSSTGWLNEVNKFNINYSDNFYKKLVLHFPDKPTELINFINQQLSYAPVNHPNKRIKKDNNSSTNYILSYKFFRIHFNINSANIMVTNLVQDPNH